MIEIEDNISNDNCKILHSKTIKNYNDNTKMNAINISNDGKTSTQSPKSHNCFRIRYDARGIPIKKGKNKKHHILFCDDLNVPKQLIHVETVESYKDYNAKNNYEDIYNEEHEKNNQCFHSRLSCCCIIY